MRPRWRAWAPVKAPFSWPKSSLSRSSGDSAAQLTATKGPLPRVLQPWTARAATSLPEPLSPSSSTVELVAATLRSACSASAMAGAPYPRRG
jgi:hypothetical protein